MVTKRSFGVLPDGREVSCYRIKNTKGAWLEVLDYGAIIQSIVVPDRNGRLEDVVLGVDDASGLTGFNYAGQTIGRCANRIAFGRFSIKGREFQLETFRGPHSLHSGSANYGKQLFTGEIRQELNEVCLNYHDNGQGGYENEAEVRVTFSFNDECAFKIHYEITPDGDTIINPTNHAYFNLAGKGTVLEQLLQINAENYTPNGDIGMPAGDIRPVGGLPLDFRNWQGIGKALNSKPDFFGELKNFDHNFMLDGQGFRLAAAAKDPSSGRMMEVYTDMPAMMFFTNGLNLPFEIKGKNNEVYQPFSAFCLETHFPPNAVNCPAYPSPVCKAGNTFVSSTIYRFLTLEEAF